MLATGLKWPTGEPVSWPDYQVGVLVIGTNDIQLPVQVQCQLFDDLMRTLALVAPQTVWAVCALLPRPGNHETSEAAVTRVNKHRQEWCAEALHKFIDWHHVLASKTGIPQPQWFRDGVHPNSKGSTRLRDYLRQQLAAQPMWEFIVWRNL
jgi:lysophospholipase L1-like esterase